jgi:error-prone DNA polymerase
VYVSAWLKRHRPAVFLAALLNSQPMGFYAPAQLVRDAQNHGVEVRPVDVTVSDWDCTLEPPPVPSPLQGEGQGGGSAVRLGLRMASGLPQAAAERILAARPFATVAELAQRAALNRKEISCLAAAGALRPLAGHRRLARWLALGAQCRPALGVPLAETLPALATPSEGEDIAADYASLGFTLGRHPLALLRPLLARRRLATAEALRGLSHGRRARAAGLVTCRQRPDTASGVIFVTLEDETGCVNVVVWSSVAERQRQPLLGARLLGVEGTIERDGEVVHLVARRLEDHSALLQQLLGGLVTHSRDFH